MSKKGIAIASAVAAALALNGCSSGQGNDNQSAPAKQNSTSNTAKSVNRCATNRCAAGKCAAKNKCSSTTNGCNVAQKKPKNETR